jgi:hypothetical protein
MSQNLDADLITDLILVAVFQYFYQFKNSETLSSDPD